MSKGQCILCGDIVESKHVHDFVECRCGESFLDGGDEYWRSTTTMVPVDDKSYTGEEFIEHLKRLDKEDGKEG